MIIKIQLRIIKSFKVWVKFCYVTVDIHPKVYQNNQNILKKKGISFLILSADRKKTTLIYTHTALSHENIFLYLQKFRSKYKTLKKKSIRNLNVEDNYCLFLFLLSKIQCLKIKLKLRHLMLVQNKFHLRAR